MVDKQSPEAQVMVQKIEALYSEVANLPQRIKFINTPQIDEAYEDMYLDVFPGVLELISNPLFVDSKTDHSIINANYNTLEAILRKKVTVRPIEGEYSIISTSIQNGLSNAADRIGWLKVLDETLALHMPLPCPEFIHDFSIFVSKKAPIISKVGLFG